MKKFTPQKNIGIAWSLTADVTRYYAGTTYAVTSEQYDYLKMKNFVQENKMNNPITENKMIDLVAENKSVTGKKSNKRKAKVEAEVKVEEQ